MCGKPCYRSYNVTQGEVPKYKHSRNVLRLSNSLATIKEDNLFGPIRIGHNQHTHTSNTRQPDLNSRVPRVHPSSRAQLEGCHSELNSRNATCLTPIPSSTQGIRSELNSRTVSYTHLSTRGMPRA
ncbi:hypothetical protein DEO72_LG3g1816 [Vigna unguiculata]|uniref:Uncharacterized protein n=1 Tax=Vigna unguiculata TaxID=3917 RepID=A0A4D6LF88_VIGUN|nr:hypothetical protein DEO72_LG3g1816 [Vigna unguiculata]